MNQIPEPTTPDALTARIYAKADEQLRSQLYKLLLASEDGSANSLVRSMSIRDASASVTIAHTHKIECRAWDLLCAAADAVQQVCERQNRENAVTEFIAKVDGLSADVAELQSTVGNLPQ